MDKHLVPLDGATFKKSSYSGGSCDNCVEIAHLAGGIVAVRDSTDPSGPVLKFTAGEWTAFTAGLKDGEFDAV